jgi:hypothetical protein
MGWAMEDAARKLIGEYWSTAVQKTNPTGLKLRWWQSPFILRHINMRVCGQPIDGISRGLIQRAKELHDKTVLELLMFIDDLCADLVETLYATALARKD